MSDPDLEIVVEDPGAPSDDSPAVAQTSTIEAATMAILMGFSLVLGFDNWRTGIAWATDGPEAGYFPFYLSLILLLASTYGLVAALRRRLPDGAVFVTRDQLRRVSQVFLPTLAFCFLTQWLGLYVASFLLIAGFMRVIGRIALWKSLLAGFVFSALTFLTFQIAFDVIMPKGPLESLFGF